MVVVVVVIVVVVVVVVVIMVVVVVVVVVIVVIVGYASCISVGKGESKLTNGYYDTIFLSFPKSVIALLFLYETLENSSAVFVYGT